MNEVFVNEVYVFVYGTLKKNQSNHSVLERINGLLIGNGKTTYPTFQMFSMNDWYPVIINGNSYINGEVYLINESDLFSDLDVLEGYPDLYQRKAIDVTLDSGSKIKAIVYYMSGSFGDIKDKPSERIIYKDNCYSWN